jgi:ribonuclease P protein component
MRSRARSNTALFRISHEADLPTVQDSTRSAPRISGAKPHARRARGAAQPPRPWAPPLRAVVAGGKRFGLGAGRRLTRSAEFERLLREGKRRSLSGYTFYLQRRSGGRARLGILVSRKHAAAATERNRIKRCIREAFRLEQDNLGSLDLLVRPPLGVRGSTQMISRLRELLGAVAAS